MEKISIISALWRKLSRIFVVITKKEIDRDHSRLKIHFISKLSWAHCWPSREKDSHYRMSESLCFQDLFPTDGFKYCDAQTWAKHYKEKNTVYAHNFVTKLLISFLSLTSTFFTLIRSKSNKEIRQCGFCKSFFDSAILKSSRVRKVREMI